MQKYCRTTTVTNSLGALHVKSLSHVRLFVTPWTVAHQAPPSMEFSRQESWSGLPFLSPGDLPDREIEPGSSAWRTDALPSEPWLYRLSHGGLLGDPK